jgi:hypothetical protein
VQSGIQHEMSVCASCFTSLPLEYEGDTDNSKVRPSVQSIMYSELHSLLTQDPKRHNNTVSASYLRIKRVIESIIVLQNAYRIRDSVSCKKGIDYSHICAFFLYA